MILRWWIRDYAPWGRQGKFNNFTIILVHILTEEKDELIKNSFHYKLNQIYQKILAHDTKIIVGDFTAKIGREKVIKQIIGKWSLHEVSNENRFTATDFETNNNMIQKVCTSHTRIHITRLHNP